MRSGTQHAAPRFPQRSCRPRHFPETSLCAPRCGRTCFPGRSPEVWKSSSERGRSAAGLPFAPTDSPSHDLQGLDVPQRALCAFLNRKHDAHKLVMAELEFAGNCWELFWWRCPFFFNHGGDGEGGSQSSPWPHFLSHMGVPHGCRPVVDHPRGKWGMYSGSQL